MNEFTISRIALVGAGATGTIMGALIARAGHDIVLVSRDKKHVDALNQNGAKISGGMNVLIPVKAITPDQYDEQYDLVIYAVKSTSDDEALSQLVPYLHENSIVLTTQNGVPEEKIASFVGKNRTLGGSIVGWAASLEAPGTAKLAGVPEEMLYKIGELDGRVTSRIQQVKSILQSAGNVVISENLAGMRWTKLLINCSMSGLSAALGCTFGEILDDEKAINVALAINQEALATASTLGVQVEQVIGIDPAIFKKYMQDGGASAREQLRHFFHVQRGGKPSMLQDLEKGKRTEVESINGFLAKKAAEAGVPTPVNESVLNIIRDIQNGNSLLSMNNLEKISLD